MGVQVRIPRPRRLVLVGDRHQTGQLYQILLACYRVVYAGVSGMGGKVFHRLTNRGVMGVQDRFVGNIIRLQSSDQGDAFGGAERQIEAMDAAVLRARPHSPLGATPWSSQRATTSVWASPPARWMSVRPTSVAAV